MYALRFEQCSLVVVCFVLLIMQLNIALSVNGQGWNVAIIDAVIMESHAAAIPNITDQSCYLGEEDVKVSGTSGGTVFKTAHTCKNGNSHCIDDASKLFRLFLA